MIVSTLTIWQLWLHFGDNWTFYHLCYQFSMLERGFSIINQPEEAEKVRFLISHPTAREVNINPVSSFISPAFLLWLEVNCKENRSCVCYWHLKRKDDRYIIILTSFTCSWNVTNTLPKQSVIPSQLVAFKPGIPFVRSQLLFKVAVYSGAIIQLSSN